MIDWRTPEDLVEADPNNVDLVDLYTNEGQYDEENDLRVTIGYGRDLVGLNRKRVQYGLAPIPTDAELSL